MMYVRPCLLSDLEALEQLAYDSPVGLTSLPEDRDRLMRRLQCSVESFAKDVIEPADEEYLFALIDADTDRVVGVSGILACAGRHEPYFNFRLDKHYVFSPNLNQRHVQDRLILCADNNGKSVFSGFFIADKFSTKASINLLARARILYMASYPERFCDEVIVEFVGVTNNQAESPFWNALGKAFFAMEYDQAEHYCGTLSKSFVGELMPPQPIYTALLSRDAQAVIGCHDKCFDDLLAAALSEGFSNTPYVDVFDAGPCFSCKKQELKSFRSSSVDGANAGESYLICGGDGLAFRCQLIDKNIGLDHVPTTNRRYLVQESLR